MDKLLNGKNRESPQGENNDWGKDYWKVATEIAPGNKLVNCRKKSVKVLILIALALTFFFLSQGIAWAVCTDADGDGVGVCPNCNIANGCAHDGNDCNDNNANTLPPYNDLSIVKDTVLCSGTYVIPDSGSQGVVLIGADNITLTCNNTIMVGSNTGYGIDETTNNGITVQGCHFEAYSNPLYSNGEDWTIRNNIFGKSATNSVYLSGAHRNVIEGNYFNTSTGTYAIYFSGSNNNTVRDNIFQMTSGEGVRLSASSRTQIIGNDFRRVNTFAIGTYNNGITLTNITRNRFNYSISGYEAIDFSGASVYNNNVWLNAFLNTGAHGYVYDVASAGVNQYNVSGMGNYWGPYSGCTDSNGDFFCDSPVDIDSFGTKYDYYAYKGPWDMNCLIPYEDALIKQDENVCRGTFKYSDSGHPGILSVSYDDLTLNCNQSIFRGDSQGIGLLYGGSGSNVTECVFKNYSNAAYVGSLWNKTLVWSGASSESGYGIDVDSSNNIYMSGYWNNGGQRDWGIAKYDMFGKQLWNKSVTWNATQADTPYDLVVDSSDDFYVVGDGYINNMRWRFAKYDPSGTELWNRSLIWGPVGEAIYSAAIDNDDNLILGGTAKLVATNDWALAKYGPSGNQIWNLTLDWSGNNDYIWGVAVDSSNNIYAAGTWYSGSATRWGLVKFSSSGNQIWSKMIGPTTGTNYAYGVTVDSFNYIYVAGYYGADWAIVKYDPAGNQVWSKTVNFGGTEYIYDIAIDSEDNILVGGIYTSGTTKWLFAKYDSDGNHLWNHTLQVSSFGNDRIQSVAIDLDDNVLLSGNKDGSNNDWAFFKLSPDGNYLTQDSRFFNDTFAHSDTGLNISYGTKGNIFYHNNFSDNNLYQVYAAASGNQFNTTVGSAAQGNWWSDVFLNMLRVYDGGSDGYADYGADYPYSAANGGNVSANVVDFGPVANPCIDADGDGIYAPGSDPSCFGGNYSDCNDNNASIMPPYYHMRLTRNITLCNGTYQLNATSQFDWNIIFGDNRLVLRGNGTVLRGNTTNWAAMINTNIYDDLTIKDLRIENCRSGIVTSSLSDRLHVRNITINNTQYGIDYAGGDYNNVDNSSFMDVSYPIYFSAATTDTNVTNIHISQANWGLALFNSGVTRSRFENITIFSADSSGIYVNGADNNRFHNVNILGDDDTFYGAYLLSTATGNNFTNCTFHNSTYGNYISAASTGNRFYYNNYSANSFLHAYDDAGSNLFNTTVGGKGQGNFWDDVASLLIFDSDGDGFGDFGADYPYNATNGGNVSSKINDWGPMTDKRCYDDDLDGAFNTSSDPDCAAYFDCNDNNASVYPPFRKQVAVNTTLCNGTYYWTPESNADYLFTLGANDVIVAGNNTRIVSTINTWGSFLFAANYHRLTVHDVEGWNLSNVVLYQGSDYGRAYNIKSNRSNAVRINGGTDHGLFWNITAYNSDALFGTGAITNNTLFNFRTNAGGVYFSSATGKSTVRDGLINDSSYGIYLFAADNMVFQNLSVNCLGANSAAYLWSGSDNNNFTNNTFYNCNRGVHITSGTGNKFYYNNFSNNALYHADAVAGNHFNWTVGGVAHGNYWDDLDTLRIFDSDGDGFGDFGADYPYNSANGGHVTANVNDWGPITDKACYDNDLDTFYSTNSHPDCPEFKDCNDNNASIMPPKDNLVVNKNITLCNGTYYINDSISSGVIQITANDVILKGNNTLIVGNGTAFSSGYGIFVNSIHRVTVQDVNVSNYSYGIYNQYANGMTIRNYTASDVGYSVYLYLVNGAAIDDIRVSDTAYWPMYFALGDNLTLTDSIFQHSGAYANLQINGAVENPCINITMNNLTLHDGGYGLELNRVYNSTFSDLNVTNQSNWHIALARVNDSRFSDISLKSQGGGGVYVSDSESNLFNNITCQDLSVGASFNQNSYHNNFTNSTFLDSISYGIEIPPSGSTDNRFYYNQFINSGTYHAMVQVAGNHFNTTDSVTGWAEGNFWDDISSLDIVDANNDGYGDTGTDYPYNSSNGGKVTTLVTDWGPIVPPESYDNITGGERYWFVETDVDMRVWTEVPNWATMYYCNASIYSPLCSIFISENTNDTVLTFNGTSNGVNQTMVRYYHVNTVPLTESPIKTQQINIVYGSYIQNSSLWNTTVENSSYIIHSDINHSVIGGCYIENSIIRNSTILELSSAKNPCRIINSTIDDSTIYSSRIYNSVIDPTTIIDSIVINSTCTDCYIEYSEIANTNFCGPFNLFAAIVTETILSGGRATYSGTNYYPVVSTDSICTFLPSVVITNPTPGSVVNGTFYINFTSTENRSLQLSIDGGTWTGLASNTSFIADSTTIQDGAHTVQIRDVDAAGHYVYSNVVTYIVDNTPDFVTILRPEAGDVLVGNVTAEVLAADYIKRVEYFLQNTTGIYSLAGAAGTKSQDTDSSDGWIQLIQSGNLGEGSYNLTVEAYERCYFVTDCFVANKTIGPLYIDRTAPTGSLTIIGTNGNTTDTIYRDVMLNVTFNDTMEVDKCRYANDAASNLLSAVWEPCTTMKAWVLSEGQGTKTVFYEIKDTSGNNQTYSDTINFYYAPDPTPPTPPIVYDGLSPSVDIDWSNSADTLSANWFGATEDFTEIYYRYRILENGSYYNNDGNWTEAGTATSFTNDTLTLLEGSNYSVEVIAYNTFGLNATAVVSDGVVIDLTEPRKPTVTSPTHPVQGQAYPESSATFHFNSSDINSSGVLSGIEGYSWKLDDWPGSAPDDIIDGRTYQELAELVTGQEELVLKINGSAAADHAFAVWKEVAGDLVANQTLRIRFALAEKVEDTRQLMNYVVAISDDGNAPYGTNPTDLLAPVQVFEKDIKYAYTMDHAYVYETTFTVNDSVTDGSFFIALGGWASDDDNLNNLSLSATDDPALVDNTTTNYVCEETVGSCVENANIEYAIGVDLMDSLNETYTVNYDLLGDGTYYFHVKAKDNAGNWGNTTHYKFVVATGGVSVSISEPVDNQMFLSPSLTYNVSVNVFVSDNASVFVTAVHPDGSSYNSTKRDIQTSGRFNVTIERGTNEIYANANSTNGVASRSSSVYVILSEEAQPATNKTLRVRYASCSNTDSNICWTNDLGGGTIAGIAAEKATVAAGELQSETIYDGIKIFATDSGGFDSTDINNMLVQNSFLDQKNPFFGLSRKISEYMVRNELRYQDLSLGGRFRLSPGTYRVYLRHNGVTADGRVNVTVVIE